MNFQGFTPATFQFLNTLEKNNNKEWFEEHKDTYEKELLTPFKELVTDLIPPMQEIDPYFELRTHRILSRIYRDIRFSKNKSPYKTSMWMTFQLPTREWSGIPGFFMELKTDNYFYGMGIVQPKRKVMDTLRDNIAYHAEEFQQETQKLLDQGFLIGGEEYKRPLSNELPEYFQSWIHRKGLYVYKEKPVNKEIFSAGFIDVLKEEFFSLAWLYDFLKNE